MGQIGSTWDHEVVSLKKRWSFSSDSVWCPPCLWMSCGTIYRHPNDSLDALVPLVTHSSVCDSPGVSPIQSHRKGCSISDIMLCNIRSLAPKTDAFACVVEHNGLEIACVTKTWLTNDTPDASVSLQGFTLFREDRLSHAGGDLAAFVSSGIPCKRLPSVKFYRSTTETKWIVERRRRLPRSVITMLLGFVYHPPHVSVQVNNTL